MKEVIIISPSKSTYIRLSEIKAMGIMSNPHGDYWVKVYTEAQNFDIPIGTGPTARDECIKWMDEVKKKIEKEEILLPQDNGRRIKL